jgi:hypothetical protein
MNEIYAVDPDAINTQRLKMLMDRFQPAEGRFVGEFPAGWRHAVGRKIPSSTISDQQLLENFLSWSGLIEVRERYSDQLSWIDNAVRIKKDTGLFERVFGESESCDGMVTAIEALLNFDVELKQSREQYIPPVAEVYGKICAPLFSMSEEVVMHDYKFCTRYDHNGKIQKDENRLGVLEALILQMRLSRKTKRFLLVMHEKTANRFKENLEDDLTAVLEIADPSGDIQVQYELDDGKFEGASSHPRCIFSIKGGLQFDQGFQVFKSNEANLVKWMSKEALLPFQKKFIPIFHSFDR